MRTITALYDSREHAEAARTQLAMIGLQPMAIQITSSEAGASESGAATGGQARSLLQAVKDFFMPDDDRHAYGEAVRRGGYLLTAKVDEERADDVCEILDDSGAIDFDERQQQWRTEGWTGRDAVLGDADAEDAIPLVEERLRVGKREIERGGVRVRSYVEDTTVSEDVELRDERVEIERRPLDQTVRGADADKLFEERTIELVEHGEEAVVAKEAVVRGEIGLRKDVDQRIETVTDTVRHTEVEVEDTRPGVTQRDDRSLSGDGASGDRDRLVGARSSFSAGDAGEHSLAMDPDSDRIGETEEERRDRLEHERRTAAPNI